ncbi:MAG: cytochrome b/b6 domain-containing protein [Prolixibacteraceae bacterium]
MGKHKIYLYPKWVRVWHGINALAILCLIITGISMQYSNLDQPIRFDRAVFLHNICGTLVSINYLYFFVANFLTGNMKSYVFNMKGLLERLILQSKYYMFGYFKGEDKPFPISKKEKFNPLQKLAYTGTMYFLVPLVIVSGLALLFPEIIFEKFMNMSGIQVTAVTHATLGFFISIFLIIHLYVASVGKHPLRNFKSIITGYHED